MKKAKRISLAIAIIIAAVMLASCIQIKTVEIAPEHTEQPTVAYSPTPKPSPSTAPDMMPLPDASQMRPVYDNTNRPQYVITVKYDDKNHSATALQTVKYTNTSADSMSELYMHIYPKHFSKESYVGMEFMGYSVYPDDKFDPGDITIKSVKAAGNAVDFTVQGEDETILKLPLEAPLMKGSSIELSLEYSLKVPHCTGRYAWGNAGTSFGNWYPIMAVYDEDGWNLDKYYELGDPFYSETADYNVTINMPKDTKAAFTGDIVSDTTADGRRILSLSETGVRDFAFVLSDDYVIDSETVDGIEIRVAIPSEYKDYTDTILGYAAKSLTLFNSRFGRYTNESLTVAFSDFFSGMEYPGIVLIADSYLEGDEGKLSVEEMLPTIEQVIAHEIGHQWWYSAVGNDEVDEAWLDEGLTSFATIMYYSANFGWDSMGLEYAEPEEGMALDMPLAAFEGWGDYYYVYSFGQSFFKTLMDKMGEYEFYTMLQKYYATYAYEIATADGLRSLVEEYGSEDALKWYDESVYSY